MSEDSGNLTTSGENNRVGPDFFGFFASEVAKVLSQDEDLLPFSPRTTLLAENFPQLGKEKVLSKNNNRTKENSGVSGSASLYADGIGALLSEFKRERLKSLLRDSAFTLTKEVDEMVNPILSVCRIRSCLRCKERLLKSDASACRADLAQDPHKKRKVLPGCSDLKSEQMQLDGVKSCTECHATSTPQWRPTRDGKYLCNACGLRYFKNLKIEADEESIEIDDDLRFLLENDSTKVEELMKKHTDELYATLQHMEQKLEELLNNVMTSCRPMTHSEKQHLREAIQKLPPENLDRVVEIIQHNKPPEEYSSDEVRVDLTEQDNATLWRLYSILKPSDT